jgi:4-hydroxybenzoate polyprenyltransferase
MDLVADLKRGLGYASTGVVAIIAGALSSGVTALFQWSSWLVYLALVVTSLPFCILYAHTYSYKNSNNNGESSQEEDSSTSNFLAWFRSSPLIILLLLCCMLIAILIVTFISIPVSVIPLFASQIVISSILYFRYVLLARKDEQMSIRNWLVLPVLYTIGINYMSAYFISEALSGLWSWLPIMLYALFFVYFIISIITEDKNKTIYKWVNRCAVVAIVISVFLPLWPRWANLFPSLSNTTAILLIAVVLSAFVATFEAWRVTASKLEEDPEAIVRKHSFYQNTSSAMVTGLILIPSFLISSSFGTVFYFGITLVGLTAIFFWFYNGIGSKFKDRNWVIWKNIFGYVVLALVFVDVFVRIPIPQLSGNALGFFSIASLLSVFGVFFYHVSSFLHEWDVYKTQILSDDNKWQDASGWDKFLALFKHAKNEPRNYNRLLGALSFVFFLIFFAIASNLDSLALSLDSEARFRTATIMYLIISIASILFDIGQRVFDIRKNDEINTADTDSNTTARARIVNMLTGVALLARAPTSLLVGMIVSVPLLISGYTITDSITMGLPFMLSAMAGFSLNDCADYKKDFINKPHRAIPSKKISLFSAICISSTLVSLSIAASLLFSADNIQLFIYIITLIGVLTYNIVVKYRAVFKTIVTAFVCIMPIVFISYCTNSAETVWTISILSFLYIFGREVRMDILDYEGDLHDGIRTLPIVYGFTVSKTISAIAIYIAIASVALAIMHSSGFIVGLTVSTIILSTQWLCEYMWYSKKPKRMKQSILIQWIPMLSSFVACILLL